MQYSAAQNSGAFASGLLFINWLASAHVLEPCYEGNRIFSFSHTYKCGWIIQSFKILLRVV